MTPELNAPAEPTIHKHRYLSERIVITGELMLTRPAHFGNGDADESTDLPLLVDEVDGRALITGASLAGALRNYLRERQWGYEATMPPRDSHTPDHEDWVAAEEPLLATQLFGGHRGVAKGAQSPLIVDDAYSIASGIPAIELRDGVALDAKTRTAVEKKKYDYQLLQADTRFNLNFELLLDDDAGKNEQRTKALVLALRGLADGEIRLGARKRRGFGTCKVSQWTVTTYQLHEPNDLLAWLLADHSDWELEYKPRPATALDIATLLGVELNAADENDCRETLEIAADFEIDGSLLIRSGFGDQDQGPDVVHLHTFDPWESEEKRKDKAVLSGTSVAGAIRQRAQRIANTLAGVEPQEQVQRFIDGMFGPAEIKSGDQLRASRVIVNEEFVTGGHELVQTRIKIDRFTGGTMETALLEEAPHFGGRTKVGLMLTLVPNGRTEAEIGLLLLVLKDLWLGDLPLGGESSVGRGRLRGQWATLKLKRLGQPKIEIKMTASLDGRITLSGEGTAETLEDCVRALHQLNWAEVK
jgi:CRISPR/Cas system CSM-associated protein Csm3 (group 7 of RAMP superfamily)